jgi:hypothetical protein
MAGNYVLLETIELTQSAASVTFDNIPQTGYSDLKIVASTRGTATGIAEANRIAFNGDTTSGNYVTKRLLGSGSSASSQTQAREMFFNVTNSATASTFANSEIYIPNYTSATAKSLSIDTVSENNATEAYSALIAQRWSGTAAITSITFAPETVGGNFTAGSTFSLYGVAAVGTTPTVAPKATGGNIVANDGTYWYHAFLSSGTFTPQTPLTCDYLVVAGGGAGGEGGGGAGGLRNATSQSLASSVNYVITVGAGGVGASNTTYSVVTPGVNSSISGSGIATYSATGGAIGRWEVNTVVAGGSGGGGTGSTSASSYVGGSGNGGSYSPVEGYAGGNGDQGGSPRTSGGGGGAGGAGGKPTAGVGSSANSSWGLATGTGDNQSGTVYYAGGGGGGSQQSSTVGAGGFGGGGRGGGSGAPAVTSGVANTGGAGGGGAQVGGSGSGGSGIVIIRYAMV